MNEEKLKQIFDENRKFMDEHGRVVLNFELVPHSQDLERKLFSEPYIPKFVNSENQSKYACKDLNNLQQQVQKLKKYADENDAQAQYFMALICIDFKKRR